MIKTTTEQLEEIRSTHESPGSLCDEPHIIKCPNQRFECDCMVYGMLVKSFKSENLYHPPSTPFKGISIADLLNRIHRVKVTSLCQLKFTSKGRKRSI